MSVAGAIIRRAQRRGIRLLAQDLNSRLIILKDLFSEANSALLAEIDAAAGRGDRVELARLDSLRQGYQAWLATIEDAQERLLRGGLNRGAQLGVMPWAAAPNMPPELAAVADDAVRFVRGFVDANGLQLSDRIWRINQGARRALAEAIESAIIQGDSASRAALEFLGRGEAVPAELAAKARIASPSTLKQRVTQALLTGEGNAYSNTVRVMRTEIVRAHGHAFRAAAKLNPDVIGMKFTLSPRHPRVDECDMHARVNRYGLGPGVYPMGRSPWPAHPNTFSYEQPVFRDEVPEDAQETKQTRVEWLEQQPKKTQIGVLAGQHKYRAFQRGWIGERSLRTPWQILRRRLVSQGKPVEELEAPAG